MTSQRSWDRWNGWQRYARRWPELAQKGTSPMRWSFPTSKLRIIEAATRLFCGNEIQTGQFCQRFGFRALPCAEQLDRSGRPALVRGVQLPLQRRSPRALDDFLRPAPAYRCRAIARIGAPVLPGLRL